MGKFTLILVTQGAKGATVGSGTAPQDGRFRVRIPITSFKLLPSLRVHWSWGALSLKQKGVSRMFLEDKVQPARGVLLVPDVIVRMAAQRAIPRLKLQDLLRGISTVYL